MKAEIIAIGSELLMGETQDTNSGWLAVRMPELGLQLQWVTVVGDDLSHLTEILKKAWVRSDYVFTIGGLGPTLDDLTREGIASMLSEEITEDPELVRWLEDSFARRGLGSMPKQNLRQAWVIPSAKPIKNQMGTAPSWWVERDNKVLVTIPGPPNELMNMWNTEIYPRIQDRIDGSVIMARTFKTIGLSEAAVDEMVNEIYKMPGIELGCYAKADGIYLRAIARAENQNAAKSSLDRADEAIRPILGDFLWGTDDESPEERVAELLKSSKFTVSVFESLTGGLITSTITEVPGSSDYLLGGMTVYSNQSKVKAGVQYELIEKYGAVSAETASAMAEAACTYFGSDCGIGVTGVAGPAMQPGESIEPGTVFIAIAHPKGVEVKQYKFPPRRTLVRGRTVTQALLQLAQILQINQYAE